MLLTFLGVLLANRYLGSLRELGWVADLVGSLGFAGAAERLDTFFVGGEHFGYKKNMYFGLFRVVSYLVPAFVVGRWVLRRPMKEFGWAVDRDWKHIRIYLALFLAMVPVVLLVSTLDSFQDFYPFYEPSGTESVWPWFVTWEIVYLLQFIGLELFFRGFALHGLVPRFGNMAIFVVLIPYVMIHFAKPAPEAVGSIVAGLVLGYLSLRSKSAVWGGLLHFGVALLMDVVAY